MIELSNPIFGKIRFVCLILWFYIQYVPIIVELLYFFLSKSLKIIMLACL